MCVCVALRPAGAAPTAIVRNNTETRLTRLKRWTEQGYLFPVLDGLRLRSHMWAATRTPHHHRVHRFMFYLQLMPNSKYPLVVVISLLSGGIGCVVTAGLNVSSARSERHSPPHLLLITSFAAALYGNLYTATTQHVVLVQLNMQATYYILRKFQSPNADK